MRKIFVTQTSVNYGMLTLLCFVKVKTVRAIETEMQVKPFLNDNFDKKIQGILFCKSMPKYECLIFIKLMFNNASYYLSKAPQWSAFRVVSQAESGYLFIILCDREAQVALDHSLVFRRHHGNLTFLLFHLLKQQDIGNEVCSVALIFNSQFSKINFCKME